MTKRSSGPIHNVGLEALQTELSGTGPAPVKEPKHIGRQVLSAQVQQAIDRLSSLNFDFLTIEPVNRPNIIYFPKAWMASLIKYGLSKSDTRLSLPQTSSLPTRIQSYDDFMAAIHESPHLDTQTAQSELTLPIVKTRFKKQPGTSTSFNLAIAVQDEKNDAYKEGFTLRGERSVLIPLRESRYTPPALDPGLAVPNHFIRLASVDINAYNFIAIKQHIREALQVAVGNEVTLSPIEPFSSS